MCVLGRGVRGEPLQTSALVRTVRWLFAVLFVMSKRVLRSPLGLDKGLRRDIIVSESRF